MVQNGSHTKPFTNTIELTISSKVDRASRTAAEVSVEMGTPDRQQAGLRVHSSVNCVTRFTVEQAKVLHGLGTFSDRLLRVVDDALKATLALPEARRYSAHSLSSTEPTGSDIC